MIFLNSSMVLLAKPGESFDNPDVEGVTQKKYPNNVILTFNPNKLIFQVQGQSELLIHLKQQVTDYCGKNGVYSKLQAIGINFLIAKHKVEYEAIYKKFNIESEKSPRFKDKTPSFQNISFQYKVSENETINIIIQKAEDTNRVQKPIPVFDINAHYNLNNFSEDNIQKIIASIEKLYNQVSSFIGGI
ncbi:MAG: hypothetical protein OXK80_06085 [Bdellovibrionales bacterium]|nr:hypothetical protein [Bdellovibrionales bacterium]